MSTPQLSFIYDKYTNSNLQQSNITEITLAVMVMISAILGMFHYFNRYINTFWIRNVLSYNYHTNIT